MALPSRNPDSNSSDIDEVVQSQKKDVLIIEDIVAI